MKKNNYELRQQPKYPQLEPLGVKHGSLPGRVTIVCQVHASSIFASLIGTPKDEHAIITHVEMRSHNLSSPLALFVQCIWSSIAAPLRNFENTSETTVPFREYHDMKLCGPFLIQMISNVPSCNVIGFEGPKLIRRHPNAYISIIYIYKHYIIYIIYSKSISKKTSHVLEALLMGINSRFKEKFRGSKGISYL